MWIYPTRPKSVISCYIDIVHGVNGQVVMIEVHGRSMAMRGRVPAEATCGRVRFSSAARHDASVHPIEIM